MRHSCKTLIGLVALAMFSGCATADAAGGKGSLSKGTLVTAERDRDYLLYTPSGLAGRQAVPLVMVFHGGGGTARGIAREVGRSLHAIADREKFYVVYPDSVDKMWDFGSDLISESREERVDDKAFFAQLLDKLMLALPIDSQRVFATGISRGGMASYFVACSLPGRIRAIAPVAMPLPEFMRPLCENAHDVGVAVMNGTDDPLVPFEGGQVTVGRRERGAVMSTDATIEFWRARNGCAAEPVERETLNAARDRTQVHRSSWTDCDYAPVLLYQIEGGGHTWPSGRQYLPRLAIGRVTRDIDGAAEVWKFFSQFESN
jgi:polyhydroxybutyrate depolymerase